jgi:hypothetical protein
MAQGPVIHVPVIAGMRQDVSRHLAPPGTLVSANNVRFPIQGEVEARPGTTALPIATDAEVTYASALAIDGVGLLARAPDGFFAGSSGYGYRYDATNERLHVGGSYANAEPLGTFATIAREESVATGPQPWPPSQVAAGGYVFVVYSSGNGQGGVGPGDGVCIVEAFTEAGVLVTSLALTSVSAAWLVADEGEVQLITQNTTTGLSLRQLTPSATGVVMSDGGTIATLASATSYWAACTWPGIGWALAYQSAAGTVMLAQFTRNTLLFSTSVAVTGTVPLSVYADATHLYFGFRDGAAVTYNVYGRVYDTTLTNTSGGSVLLKTEAVNRFMGPPLFGPLPTAGRAMWAISRITDATFTGPIFTVVGSLTSAGVATEIVTCDCVTAASAPFGNGYLWVRSGGTDGPNGGEPGPGRWLLYDFMALRLSVSSSSTAFGAMPVIALSTATSLAGANAERGYWLQHLCPPVQLDDDSWVVGSVRLVRNEEAGSPPALSGLGLSEWLRFTLGGVRQAVPFGNEALVAGWVTLARTDIGTLHYSTAGQIFAVQRQGLDVGFPAAPMLAVTSVSNSTGGLTNNASYQYRAVAERIDSAGRRWRSAPSVIATATTGAADDTVVLSAFCDTSVLRAGTSEQSGDSAFVVHFYRTAANGSTFYRASPPQGAPVIGSGGEFTYTDVLADSVLTEREILYTDGGVTQNDPPPSCRFIRATEDRVWLGGLWETEQLQSSKILVPGEPPQFSDLGSFRVVLPVPCTGIAVQDGIVFAFGASSIYAIQGAGPDDQGQGAWETPRCITSAVGCINHLSILETSAGVFFQSDRGIELMPRGAGEPQFIGEPIMNLAADLSSTGTITSAAVVTSADTHTARFTLSDNGTGAVLVYDLDAGAWSYDTYPVVPSAICDTDEGAVIAFNSPASGYGFVREPDNPAVRTDATSAAATQEIASSLTWSAIHPFGIAGWGHFHSCIGMFDSASAYRTGTCTLRLSVDANTDDGAAFQMSGMTAPDYRRRVPRYDVGTAAILRLSTTVAGWKFMGWTVEVEDSGGARRVAETEQS